MSEDRVALTLCAGVEQSWSWNALQPTPPRPLPAPAILPPPHTLFTTKKFSMVFPLAKTTSPVSFTASGRISFTSWAMTPGGLGGGEGGEHPQNQHVRRGPSLRRAKFWGPEIWDPRCSGAGGSVPQFRCGVPRTGVMVDS